MHKVSNTNVGRWGRITSLPQLKAQWSENHLLRNSVFLAAASVFTAGLGFLFWTVVARMFTPQDVGIATSFISTASLVAYLSLFGLNSSLVRFLPGADHPNALVTQATAGVTVVAVILGTACALLFPLVAPRLGFVSANPLYVLLFVVFAVMATVNLLTDAVFIAARKTQYNIVTDGFLQGLVKLALPFLLVGSGAIGIFAATGIASAVAVLASLILLHTVVGTRPDFRPRHTELTRQLRYSSSTYISSVLNLVPVLVVPLIILEKLGPAQAGFYYVAYQVANLLNAFATAVGEALFAEGSHDASQFISLMRRSARLLAIALLPTAALVAAFSEIILQIFGAEYRQSGEGLLLLLAGNAVFVGLNTWASFALKILGVMRPLIVSNVIYSLVVVTSTFLLAPQGLVWTGLAWITGTAASGLYAAAAVRRHLRSTKDVGGAGAA